MVLRTTWFLEMNTSSDYVTRQLDKTSDQRMLQELANGVAIVYGDKIHHVCTL